jgi:molybdopterin-containing oxidoreductase family iron-sulfur binding subunit
MGIRGSLIQVEPRMSLTGASADEWVAIKPGTEGILALGLAKALGGKNLDQYTPEDVERQTGVKAARVERLARMLAEQKPAVAIIAGAPLAYSNGLFQAQAVNTLNTVLGAVDAPGGLSFTPQGHVQTGGARALQTFAADVLSGKRQVQVLLVDGVNPVHTTPAGWKTKDALAKIPYIVSFGSFADDTSVMADLLQARDGHDEGNRDARRTRDEAAS